MLEYIDIPNSIVGAFGMLNRACGDAGKVYVIRKEPREMSYTGWVGDSEPIHKDLCDDLFAAMIEQANSYNN